MCFFDFCCNTPPSKDNSYLDNLDSINQELLMIRNATDKKLKDLQQRQKNSRVSRNKKQKSFDW